MKKVELNQLVITNFKGIKSLSVDFKSETFIHAANGLGKTTINDAFLWLLFGKNSDDKKDFSIKPRDMAGNQSEKLEIEVEGLFMVDGKPITIKRVLREKWVKSRGDLESTFTGNETLFFWNEVPCQAGEFQSKVSELIDEKLFKLITSPYAFASLGWQDRRAIITKIVGEVSDNDIAATRKEFIELLNTMAGKSLEEFKKEIAAKKKKLKDELDLIPARIDEIKRGMPETPNTDLIQIDINNAELEITKCNDRIKDVSKASEEYYKEKAKRNQRIGELNSLIFNLTEKAKQDIRSGFAEAAMNRLTISNEIQNIEKEIGYSKSTQKDLLQKIFTINNELLTLRNRWTEEDKKQPSFNETEFLCPVFKRACIEIDAEAKKVEITENFNSDKAVLLAKISAEGKQKNVEKTNFSTQVAELEESIKLQSEILETKKAELNTQLNVPDDYEINLQAARITNENAEYKTLTSELYKLNELNNLPFSESNDTSVVEAERKQHELTRDQLKYKLRDQEVIDKGNARTKELNDQMRSFSQQIADLEKMIFTMDEFEKLKINMVEDKVNELFTQLKFKMFVPQINGGMAPACEILINGVPFTDANTASKINAGIEIINILCENYQISAPIFIDNRESCTSIIASQSQLINLVVSPEDKQIRIN
jgi:exonuclease SbcC